MIVVRVCCPVCIQETAKEIRNEQDFSHYEETIEYKVCEYHPETATEKLLRAIFGEDSNQR